MAAEIIVADAKTVAGLPKTILGVERRAEAGAAEHLVCARIMNHLGADIARQNRDGVVLYAIWIENLAVGLSTGKPLAIVAGVYMTGEQELVDIVYASDPPCAFLGAGKR